MNILKSKQGQAMPDKTQFFKSEAFEKNRPY